MSRAIFAPKPAFARAVHVTASPAFAATPSLGAPALLLLGGAIAATALLGLEGPNVGGLASTYDALAVLAASICSTAAVALAARRVKTPILSYRALAVTLALAGAGMSAADLRFWIGPSAAVLAANLLFAAATGVGMPAIVPALYRRLDRRTAFAAALDGGIMLLAGITLLLTVWQARLADPRGSQEFLVAVLATAMFASGGVATIAALAMRAEPVFRGIWAGILGVLLLGLCWITWFDSVVRGQPRTLLESVLFVCGVVVVSYGWLTWNERTGGGRLYEAIAHWLGDWLPMAAIMLCVTLDALPREHPIGLLDPAPLGTAAVMLVAVARQRLLLVSERDASRRLTREVEERAATMVSLARLEPAETVERTAGRICVEALRLDGIDAAAIYAFSPAGAVVPLALAGIASAGETVGEPLSLERAGHLRICALDGTWIDSQAEASRTGRLALLGEAFAPLHWDDRVIGVVAMGTTQRADASRLSERLSTVTEFGVMSAAMLGSMLDEHWRQADIRAQLDEIIATHAFRPVFQPVVELATRRTVGFEALTRFNDGTRPDHRFLEANSVGMSIRLETACLSEQLEAATWLPEGTWLSLNVSPVLAGAIVPLISALEKTDREVVLEITEHVEIPDYRLLAEALSMVRGRASLAVDDAGAGYAGLRHILELNPQYVKLDISLVRSVDADPARQAMVAGMAHFARNAGCQLIAEGIETAEELAALQRLGITLGQGYLLGRPGPID